MIKTISYSKELPTYNSNFQLIISIKTTPKAELFLLLVI